MYFWLGVSCCGIGVAGGISDVAIVDDDDANDVDDGDDGDDDDHEHDGPQTLSLQTYNPSTTLVSMSLKPYIALVQLSSPCPGRCHPAGRHHVEYGRKLQPGESG